MTAPKTGPELLPCPFCGCAGMMTEYSGGNLFSVSCENLTDDCYVETSGWKNKAFAVAAWNRRAPLPRP